MSYVRITARRDDGLEVEFEIDEPIADYSGGRTAENIERAARKAVAAIVSGQPLGESA